MELPALAAVLGRAPAPEKVHLYLRALVHSSYANERGEQGWESNERLEFLGDAVLQLVVSEYLYTRYGSLPEGELTRIRAAVVSTPTLARKGAELGLGRLLLLGKGEEATGGRERASLLENAFEALVGAVFLDGGLEEARRFVLRALEEDIALAARGEYRRDWKTELQELTQREGMAPEYRVVAEGGPDHAKWFEVVVLVGDREAGRGRGRSKKEAEQEAARTALAAMQEFKAARAQE